MADETPQTNDAPSDRGAARYGAPEEAPKVEKPETLAVQAAQSKSRPETRSTPTKDEEPADRQEARFGKSEDPTAPETVHGAPDRGYALQAPEGLELTGDILKEISPTLKELNLSNAGAQKLMPLAGKFHQRIIEGQHKAHLEVSKEWAREVKADPDLGRGNFRETMRLTEITMKAAGDFPELHELMTESKLGNHPAIVRAFRNIGRRLERSSR